MFKIFGKNNKNNKMPKICPDCGMELTSDDTLKISVIANTDCLVYAYYCTDCGAKRFANAVNSVFDIRNKEED